MRMLLLAGGAAVAALAVVLVVGLGLIGDDGPSWGDRATEICDEGLVDTRAVIGAAETSETFDERTLRAYAGATEVEARVLDELDALPRPSGDDVVIEQTLRVLRDSHREDVAAVARLRRTYDAALVQRRVDDSTPLLAYAREKFGSLGADGCVVYYDPESYG